MEPTDWRQEITPSDVESATFQAYLDGLLAMPSETERIIAEMEQEKGDGE